MKSYLLLLLLVLTSFKNNNEKPIDRLGVKGPLQFNNDNYNLAWTSNPSDNYFIQEYIPNGQKVEDFKQMLTIYFLNENKKAKEAVQQKINELEKRKKNDATCNYELNESPDGNEFILDFLMGESDNKDKMTLVEFNIYRFQQVEFANNKNGLVIYAYSKRAYGNEIDKFLKNLGKSRENLLNVMIETNVPVIKVQN